jgi:hypothetical protein
MYSLDIEGSVYRIDRASGAFERVAMFPVDSDVPEVFYALLLYFTPVVADGRLLVVDSTGAIIAFGDARAAVAITENMAVEVVGETTSLRAAPSSAAVSRGELQRGAGLRVIGAAEEREGQLWWPVAAEDGATGWLPESAIVAAGDPPTPTSTLYPPASTAPPSTSSPALTGSAAPEESEFKPTHRISADQPVNLRTESSANAPVIATLPPGTPLQYLNEDVSAGESIDGHRWMLFRTEYGQEGWVLRFLVIVLKW